MLARILPRDEWYRLGETPQPVRADLFPRDVSVVVVEDGSKIVARMFVMNIVHFEGLWIDPEYRNAGVGRSLLRLTGQSAHGEKWALAAISSDEMRGILGRIGGKAIDATFYTVPVGG